MVHNSTSLQGESPAGSREIAGLLRVSQALADAGADLHPVLNTVAREAARVVDGAAASVLLAVRQPPNEHGYWFRAGGIWGLSDSYRVLVELPTGERLQRKGLPSLTLDASEPMVIEDISRDDVYAPWRDLVEEAGVQSVACLPLNSDNVALGVLEVYQSEAGPWSDHELNLLRVFSHTAVSAIRTVRLLERHQREVHALSQLVRLLREQAHEHANRLHAFDGMLGLGDVTAAHQFARELASAHHRAQTEVVARIEPAAVAGLIIAELSNADQRGIELTLDPRSRLVRLPAALSDADTVSILGNLLQNAFEAVGSVPPNRRRVRVWIRTDGKTTTFSVRDWGPGVPPELVDRIFSHGYSSKADHPGVGLSIVSESVAAAGGRIFAEERQPGSCFVVEVPNA